MASSAGRGTAGRLRNCLTAPCPDGPDTVHCTAVAPAACAFPLYRRLKASPDQVSSIEQTLKSTQPVARPVSRTTLPSRSVLAPDAFFGQANQAVCRVTSRGRPTAAALPARAGCAQRRRTDRSLRRLRGERHTRRERREHVREALRRAEETHPHVGLDAELFDRACPNRSRLEGRRAP